MERADGELSRLWFRVDAEHASGVSARTDAALLGLIVAAMAAGEDITVEGVVTQSLARRLKLDYQILLRLVIPQLSFVSVECEAVTDEPTTGTGVAMGFSGGIDSFDALAEFHYAQDVPSGGRITHLLYANVGSHGAGGHDLFRARFERLEPLVTRMGLPFIAVDSNLDDYYANGPYFPTTYVVRLSAVAFLLAGMLDRYLCASATWAENVHVGPSKDMGDAAPVMLTMLNTRSLDLECVGTEYTRVEKVTRVATIADSYEYLDVCMRPHGAGNCSACRKCLRTILTLELLGKLDLYSEVFDFDTYRRLRTRYIANLLLSTYPYDQDVMALARRSGLRIPVASRLLAPRYQLESRLWRRPFG